MKLGISVDLPWYLASPWKVIRAFLPKALREHAIAIKREELIQYVDIEEIPINLGGKRPIMYDLIDQMSPLKNLKHLNLTEKQIEHFYKTYNFDNACDDNNNHQL